MIVSRIKYTVVLYFFAFFQKRFDLIYFIWYNIMNICDFPGEYNARFY